MGRHLLIYTLLIFIFFGFINCKNRKNEQLDKSDFFIEGEKWHIGNYKVTSYPTLGVNERDKVIISIEEGLKDWEIIKKDTLILTNKKNKMKMVFSFKIIGDTLFLNHESNTVSKLVIKEKLDKEINFELIGRYKAHIQLLK